MTIKELETRVETLEKTVQALQTKVNGAASTDPNPIHWWTPEGGAGRFENDPVFDEIVRLGREYRESLHPDRVKKKATKAKKSNTRA
jgi:hypothetical protein